MAQHAIASPPKKVTRGETRPKIVTDDGRRDRFKGRAKDLERGISAPSLFSDEGEVKAGPKAPLPLTQQETITVGLGLGHDFAKKTFFQPTYCHYCSDMMWGFKGQGYMCTVCNYVSHEKCVPFLNTVCRHVMADSIQEPVAHKWTKQAQSKKKHFCNVCRKKISSDGELICEVCKFYCHNSCKEVAFNNCKQSASYSHSGPSSDTHHWIEGNLPSSARCQVCTKSCTSTDCLTGFRCGWCGVGVHSKCLEKYKSGYPECTFRDLWGMILVPRAIMVSNIGETNLVTPTSGDQCSVTEEDEEETEEDTDGGKGRPVMVIDGSSRRGFQKWRKTTVQPTYLTKKMTANGLLVISLRKCGISDNPEDYYLADVVDQEKGTERELTPDEIPFENIPLRGPGILRLYIRHKIAHKENNLLGVEVEEKFRVNNGTGDSETPHIALLITSKTTVKEIISQAVSKFGLEAEKVAEYCLVEVSQVAGVMERVLADNETPWKKFQDLRRGSLILSSRQRYFLKHRKGGQVSIYIRDLEKEVLLAKEKYTEYVKSLVTADYEVLFDKVEIGPAFPSLGGLILTFPTFELASTLTIAMQQNPTKPSIVMIPSIYPEVTTIDQEPLLVFINSKSGGNQGVDLYSAFCRHLNPHQVWDLSKGGPMPGIWSMRVMKKFRILIGGGDGTFGWVLGALQDAKEYLKCKEPPSALLPLGTGNDLARALKWGGGYTGEKVMQVLLTVEDANIVHLDRWTVSFLEQQLPRSPKLEKPVIPHPSEVVMNNYTGIGLDAAIALDFHLAREENPEKFSSRLHNKGFYLQLGLQKMVQKPETRELHRHMTLTVDGNRVELPDIAGLIILNIQSWGAGADPWGTSSDPAHKLAAYDDGLLEVVGIKGVMQMGQVQSGIRNAVRIAQGSELSIDLLSPLPVQVDGEAWAQPPSTITITKLPDPAVMLQGPNKQARQLSKKEATSQIEVLHAVSSSEILFSDEGLSSRRSGAKPAPPAEDK